MSARGSRKQISPMDPTEPSVFYDKNEDRINIVTPAACDDATIRRTLNPNALLRILLTVSVYTCSYFHERNNLGILFLKNQSIPTCLSCGKVNHTPILQSLINL